MLRAIRFEEFDNPDTILSLSREWEAFHSQVTPCVPFVQPAYVALWSRILGKLTIPRVTAVWNGKDLIGYAPFMVAVDPFGPFTVGTLKFIGNNIGYPGDILYADIVTSKPRKQVLQAILAHAKTAWKLAKWDFGYLHPHSLTNVITREILSPHEDEVRSLGSQPYVTLELPSDWDAYVMALSRNTRQSFRRHMRKLEELGNLRIRVNQDPETAAQRVKELIGNHERWWRRTPKEGWFGDEAVHRFLVSAARLLASQGRYQAFALELDGTPIAWNVGAFDGRRYFEQMLSYDQRYASYSPGMILSMFLIRHLISTNVRHVELGPGFDQRKQRLRGKPTECSRIQGYLGWARRIARIRRFWTKRFVSS